MTYSNRLHPQSQRTRYLSRMALFTLTAFLTVATFAVLMAPRASAISDAEELTRFGSKGADAGQFFTPEGIATDPRTGHVLVVDEAFNRISEFTPWGNFVKAFGWDVAPGAVNEQQEVRVRAASGQFRLTFGASSTPDLPFDASAAEVGAALNALASIGGAGAEVSVEANPGTTNGVTPFIYLVTFKGSLAATNVAQLMASNGTPPLGGGVPSTELETRIRADGTAGGAELESCTAESSCQAGLGGSGAGQFFDAERIAIDAAGDIYVREISNLRVQKFDSAGRFLLIFGGEVNKTKSAEGTSTEAERNRCTKAQLEGGDVCGIGVAGAGNGQFGDSSLPGIALGAGGKLFVNDIERIQRFNAEGEYEASIPILGKTVHDLAIDPLSSDFYATVGSPSGPESDVRRLDSVTGAQIDELGEPGELTATGGPIATDPLGNVFVQGPGPESTVRRVKQFDSDGKQTSEFGITAAQGESVDALATNAIGDVYAAYTPANEAFIRLFGPPPVQFEGPPPVPPTISAQFASSVGRSDALVAAEINPHFFTSARYYVQYGTGKCSEGGCQSEKPLAPGALLTTKVTASAVKSAPIFLEGLQPATTYHYRFVAESLGGGPVRGVGGEVGIDGQESTFTTYPAPAQVKTDCPNQSFRTGFSAPLPDCRAFEMVTPIDKNNGDIIALSQITGYPTSIEQSAVDGSRFTYSSYRSFAEAESGAYTMQYLSSRKEGVGWSSRAINPAQGHATATDGLALEGTYRAFSDDLCSGWLVLTVEPVLAPAARDGDRTLYRRENCGADGYEALAGVERTPTPDAFPELQGTSADGKAAIVRAKEKLTEDAKSGVWQAYLAQGEELHLICVLPSGVPSGGNCSGGMGDTSVLNRTSSVTNAISDDGSRAYWTDSGSTGSGPGKVYLRLNPGEEQSALSGGECTEPERACTVKVSETVSTKASRYLGASADGAKALFEVTEGLQDGNLYRFDAGAAESTLIAGETLGVAGMSADLSRVYFVSEEALGGAAVEGKPNLYLEEGGSKTFIATLSGTDLADASTSSSTASNTASKPVYHAARASDDGRVLAFISTESLTGYDNTDQVSGKADSEVYRYEVGSPGPVCVSCNPSGARPFGRLVKLHPKLPQIPFPTAASIPVAQSIHHFPDPLSADGKRLFFKSYDVLLPRDSNGKADVYEWQAASGQKECEERGAELYVPSSAGCLSLISSGQSPSDSEFLDTSSDGEDVFFATNASLLPQDPGLIDIYDARANGGLPGPPEPPGPCQGEACQIAPPPPNDPTPASASFKGVGNLKATPRCRKGKVARKGRCVAKKRKQAKKRHSTKRNANRNRGASR